MSEQTQVLPTDQAAQDAAAAAAATETPPLPERFEMGDSERATTREIHAKVRELARLSKATEDRKAELAALDERIGGVRPKVPEVQDDTDSEGLVTYRGMRLPKEGVEYLRSLENAGASTETALREMRADLAALRDADLNAEREEMQEALDKHFSALTSAARSQMIPGLSDRAGRRADKEIRDEFQARMEARRAASGDEFQITDEMIADEMDASAKAVRDDMTEMGWRQLKVNREAAALQPPALGGTPAEPGPKDYSQLSPAEQAAARAEARMTGGKITFTGE